jgi:putative phosphonate metabolism protein
MASGTRSEAPPIGGWTRYAVYWRPVPDTALGRFGAAWLGWEPAGGRTVAHPAIADLPQPVATLTGTPRRYGLHATIKAPFRLGPGADAASLAEALGTLAERLEPVACDGLALAALGDFLALVPEGDAARIGVLASAVVAELDGFRAPLTPAEVARRNPERLSAAQRALLDRWGYPYVMAEFRFHVSLTGALSKADAAVTRDRLAPMIAPILPRPFRISELTLCGEDTEGRFHDLARFALRGR